MQTYKNITISVTDNSISTYINSITCILAKKIRNVSIEASVFHSKIYLTNNYRNAGFIDSKVGPNRLHVLQIGSQATSEKIKPMKNPKCRT